MDSIGLPPCFIMVRYKDQILNVSIQNVSLPENHSILGKIVISDIQTQWQMCCEHGVTVGNETPTQ